MGPDDVSVLRLTSQAWRTARAHRLRALATDPFCFGTSLDSHEAMTDSDWQIELSNHAWLFASISGAAEPVGLAVFYGDDVFPDGAPQLGAMWVEPRWRRIGVAAALSRAVEAHARDAGANAIGLWVTAENPTGMHVYQKLGYRLTGATKPAPRDPSVVMQRMVKAVGDTGRA